MGGMSMLMGFGMLLGVVLFTAIVALALAVVGVISLARRGDRGDGHLAHAGREPDDDSRA